MWSTQCVLVLAASQFIHGNFVAEAEGNSDYVPDGLIGSKTLDLALQLGM